MGWQWSPTYVFGKTELKRSNNFSINSYFIICKNCGILNCSKENWIARFYVAANKTKFQDTMINIVKISESLILLLLKRDYSVTTSVEYYFLRICIFLSAMCFSSSSFPEYIIISYQYSLQFSTECLKSYIIIVYFIEGNFPVQKFYYLKLTETSFS